MPDINKAYRVRNGISLQDNVNVFKLDVDPTISGFAANSGSLCITPIGLYWKSGTGDTEWTKI